MRVMYVQPAEGFGGAERQGVLHVKELRRLGFEVVTVVGPGERIRRALEAEGIHDYIFYPGFLHGIDRPLSTLRWVATDLAAVRAWMKMQDELGRVARERAVELFFASRPYGWIMASPVAKRLGLPLVWRGGSRLVERGHRVGLRVLSRLWRPDALVCNCEAVRQSIQPVIGAPLSYIVANGVDTERFDPRTVAPQLRLDLDLDVAAPVVGFAGRPAPEKGFELLSEVVARTARCVPDVRLLVAGEFGWRRQYEEMFRRHGLADRVTFLGHVEHIEAFYASCDVVVLTSSSEGSSNAVLEAMAMQRPVVVTDVGGLPEIIEHGVQGFLVRPHDAEGFAARLVELLESPAARLRMGAAGRTVILRRFSDRTVSYRLASVLRGVAARLRISRARPTAAELGSGVEHGSHIRSGL